MKENEVVELEASPPKKKISKFGLQKLEKEIQSWVDCKILTTQQKEQILNLYEINVIGGGEKKPLPSLTPILIGLGTVLVCVAVFMFFAANWRYMPPVFKLAQVFAMVIGAYSASYYAYEIRKAPVWGRAFLLMGVVFFGAAMALVAQIYHISSHPADGVLVWGLVALAMSWNMREKWGLYIATVLLVIWNEWEFSVYNNVNYAFLPVVAILLTALYTVKSRRFLSLCALLPFVWFYQTNYLLIDAEASSFALIFLHIPFGVLLLSLSSLSKDDTTMDSATNWLQPLAWVYTAVPLIVFSIPWYYSHEIGFANLGIRNLLAQHPFVFFVPETKFLLVQFGVLFALAVAVSALAYRKQKNYSLLAMAGLSILPLVLPLGNETVLFLSTSIALLAMVAAVLYKSAMQEDQKKQQLAYGFTVFVVLSKAFGLMLLLAEQQNFAVAYSLLFVMFCLAIVAIDRFIASLVTAKQKTYPKQLRKTIYTFIFAVVFVLTFPVWKNQIALPDAGSHIQIMAALYAGVIVIFAGLLASKSKKDLMEIAIGSVVLGVLFGVQQLVDITFVVLLCNVVMLGMLGLYLYISNVQEDTKETSYQVATAVLVAKFVGFMYLAFDRTSFMVVYTMMAILFCSVIMLLNRIVRQLVENKQKTYQRHLIDQACIIASWVAFYIVAFPLQREQNMIFEASMSTKYVAGLIILMAVAMYGFLAKVDLKGTVGSLIVFVPTTALLFLGLSLDAYALLFNFVLFCIVILLIYYSFQINSTQMLNIAISAFVLQVVTRYFDVLWNLLSGSALFFATGVLFLGGGYIIDKYRKKLLTDMDKVSTGVNQ